MGDALKQYQAYYTVSEWEHWQDAWELIDGVPYCMSPAPSFRHQRINTKILIQVEKALNSCKKCQVIMPIDWQISEDTVVQPDISVICKEVTGKRLLEPPTAIFEILSSSTVKKDRTIKFDLFQEQGVKYYIIVNPEDDSIEIYMLDSYVKYQRQTETQNFIFNFDGCEVQPDFSSIW